jgi:hypothetical protein
MRSKKEKPDNRSGLFHTCAHENKVRDNDMRIPLAVFPTSHQFWGQRIAEYPNPEQPLTGLRSSQLIAVCKRSGRVLYAGSAGDEW